MTSDLAAEDIAEELLYLTGKAIMAGQFNHFQVHFQLPQVIETISGSKIIQTVDDMRAMFDSVQNQMRENEVSDLVRTISNAEFIDADTIGSTHVSSMIKEDGSALGAPYPTYSILRRTKDGWKIAGSRVVILDGASLNQMLITPSGNDVSPSR